MAQRQEHVVTGTPRDPLEFARAAARFVSIATDIQASDDPDVQIRAYISQLGKQSGDTAFAAGMMALVSIAESLDRIADLFAAKQGERAEPAHSLNDHDGECVPDCPHRIWRNSRRAPS
jgi:hypothetical protein